MSRRGTACLTCVSDSFLFYVPLSFRGLGLLQATVHGVHRAREARAPPRKSRAGRAGASRLNVWDGRPNAQSG